MVQAVHLQPHQPPGVTDLSKAARAVFPSTPRSGVPSTRYSSRRRETLITRPEASQIETLSLWRNGINYPLKNHISLSPQVDRKLVGRFTLNTLFFKHSFHQFLLSYHSSSQIPLNRCPNHCHLPNLRYFGTKSAEYLPKSVSRILWMS